MPCDSILEIPKAASSDENTTKDPYVADSYKAPPWLSYQRERGTAEFVARAVIVSCFSPIFVERLPGKLNENTCDSDTGKVDAFAGVTST